MTPNEIIAMLGMRPHPEGGHFVETWRHVHPDGGRGAGTAIYFLLQAGERSHWHRVDAAEIWHWYAGAPLEMSLSPDGVALDVVTLGNGLLTGARPQVIVPAGIWQSAVSTGEWTLIGCTVSPAFEFSGFEMAPPGWTPGK
ncbi:MAG TPA: cupin domain-containing protein [Hyphomicrobiaceae bacterium]|nr:cupin domain-containing protein [Hyphomicrobiaceae bacterium]